MFVAITIHPSILRTATALVEVRASDPELGLVSLGEALPFCGDAAGGTESISISDILGDGSLRGDILGRVSESRNIESEIWCVWIELAQSRQEKCGR